MAKYSKKTHETAKNPARPQNHLFNIQIYRLSENISITYRSPSLFVFFFVFFFKIEWPPFWVIEKACIKNKVNCSIVFEIFCKRTADVPTDTQNK